MNIQLTISLLVSDRMETLGRCLASIKPLLRELDSELIVVYTGSNPAALELARQYTSHIIPFTWCNDFAKARNTGLKEAKGEWFLYLDDDEWFDDTTEIIRFFQSGESARYLSATYKQRNYQDWEGTCFSDSDVARMCRLTPETRFIYPIHENLDPFPEPYKKFQTFVHHFGYVGVNNEEEQSAKSERNISLLQKRLEEDGDTTLCYVQLAQEYRSCGDYETAICYCREGIRLAEKEKRIYSMEMWLRLHLPIWIAYSGDLNLALEEGEKMLASPRLLEVGEMQMAANLVNFCWDLNEYQKGLKYVRLYHEKMQYLRKHPEKTSHQTAFTLNFASASAQAALTYARGLVFAAELQNSAMIKQILTWMPWKDREQAAAQYRNLEDWKNSYIKQQEMILESYCQLKTDDPYVNLQKAIYIENTNKKMKCSDVTDASDAEKTNCEITEGIPKTEHNRAEKNQNLEKMKSYWTICAVDCPSGFQWQLVEIAVRNQIPLKPLLAHTPLEVWNECAQFLSEHIEVPGLPDFYRKILPELSEYPLFAERLNQYFLEKQLTQGLLEPSHLTELLSNYCESLITDAKILYRDEILENPDSYALPSRYKFGIKIQKALELIDNRHFADSIPLLKDALYIYPQMSAAVSHLTRYLNEKIQAPPQTVSEEFQTLGIQVKQMLHGLMEQHQWEEAYGVNARLVELLPDDLEVLRLKQEILRQGK